MRGSQHGVLNISKEQRVNEGGGSKAKYVPPQKHKERDEHIKEEEEEDDDPVEQEIRPPMPPKTTAKCPFDDVQPIIAEPIPQNQTRPEKKSHSDNKGDEHSGKGPKFHMRSELFKPGLDEALANCIFKSKLELTAEELMELVPAVKKILLRKAKNTRVKPHKRKAAFYILLDDLSIDEHFEVLLADCDGMKAGSLVQQDIVEVFHSDIPEGDARHGIVIVGSKSNGLRSIYPHINNSDEEPESILNGGSLMSVHKGIIGKGRGMIMGNSEENYFAR
ncbi:hypothetical protein J3R30DRAFT_3695039 [Lentinula aciculospora]|uniref:Uncharacterized protein n=1 Tax=Lentinula aciculospora TaxID=153920 RepID=A0A9W9APE6_9AGAR|nr:hypothetical protein J3R30DRAFT_3695039 [Lentinula aciculospora]